MRRPPVSHPEVCKTLSELASRDGDRVIVEGVYVQPDFSPSKARRRGVAVAAALRLEDGELVYLAPYWHPDAVRESAETERWAGQTVQATGVFHARMPPDPSTEKATAHPGQSCFHPVELIASGTPRQR